MSPSRWTQLSHRRLQTWPSPLSKTNTLLAAPLTPWLLNPIVPRFHGLEIFTTSPHAQPNHVLINEYKPGEGIMPHEDGAAYHQTVATISLGAPIVLDIYGKTEGGKRREKPSFRVLQEPGSLLVTRGELYTEFLHGIAEVEVDEGLTKEGIVNWALLGRKDWDGGRNERRTRVSLTYRDVLKVSNLGKRFLGRG